MLPMMYADIIDDVGNRIQFEEIYQNYHQQMFFRANQILQDAYEAEDAVHDALIGVARNMKTIHTITDPQDLFYYLMRCADNAAYNRTRQTRHFTTAAALQDVPAVSDRTFWDTICTRLDYERLVQLITDLPAAYRETLYYHFVLEFSVPETARSLNIPLSTAKKQLVRGKKLLLQKINEKGDLYHGND